MNATSPATPLAPRLHAVSRICAASVVALGIAVLIGWIFDIAAIKYVVTGAISMKANTALLFVLLGTALLIAEVPSRRTLRTGLGLFVATVAGLTLVEYGFAIDLGIDELLVRDREPIPPIAPGRMAFATAVNFVLLGLAVAAFDVEAVYRLRQAAVLAASGVAFVILCGYLFGVESLYSVSLDATVALHTAIGFLLVATAYALSPSQHLVDVLASDTVAGRLLRRLLPSIVVLPMLVGRLMLEWRYVEPYVAEFEVSVVVLLTVLSLGSVAWFVGHRLYLTECDVHGERTRAEEERSLLVAELRRMTQELEQRVEERTRDLREREVRYRALFDESPVALWEKDCSAALAFLHEAAPAQQIRERLRSQVELVEAAAAKMRIVDANRRGLELFGADDLPELAARWSETLRPESYEAVGGELLALLDGRAHFETECVRHTLTGQPLHVRVQLTALPAARVIVSMVDITASKQAERQLREAVARQEVLLREIHHRVKNNLAVIASLFYLSSTHTTDASAVALLEDSRRRIRSMALVHETLYGSDNLACIDMAEYTRILANEVMAAYRPVRENVQLFTELQPVSLSVDLAVPCGLILNELISNAFKHAFPDGRSGVVHVSLREITHPGNRADGTHPGNRADGTRPRNRAACGADCIMCVNDDGVGMPADLDVATHHSLGLRLVRLLTTQLRGVVEFERQGPGTLACVSFTRSDEERRSDDC